MDHLFDGAKSFNQPLDNWTTNEVVSMSGMCMNATSFDQPLGSWDVSQVAVMDEMLLQCYCNAVGG
jgi:hypothetical protein